MKKLKNKILGYQPFISIVIVVFNAEKYIREAIESIINQDFKNMEILIIDGGSSDNTISIISEYKEHLSYFISEKDEGQSHAFEKAFSKCKGEWLTWLNSDDILMHGTLNLLETQTKLHPKVNCFFGNIIWVDDKKKVILCRKGEKWSPYLAKNGFLNPYGPSTFFKKSLYQKVKGVDRNLHYRMDTDLWWQFFFSGAIFKRLNKYTWMLRVHKDAKTTANYFLDNDEQKTVKDKMIHETNLIRKRYKVSPSLKGKFILLIFRLFSIRYLYSLLDSIRYKGKKYPNIKKL